MDRISPVTATANCASRMAGAPADHLLHCMPVAPLMQSVCSAVGAASTPDYGGDDTAAVASDGKTALIEAAASGQLEFVNALLAQGMLDVNATNACGATALSRAAERGHAQVVEQLLQVPGIDTKLADKYGRTPLVWAQLYGHYAVIALLRRAESKPQVEGLHSS